MVDLRSGMTIIPLADHTAKDRQTPWFDFMLTGASDVSIDGVRCRKWQEFYDPKWAMFTDFGLVDETTPVEAVIRDC